MEWNDFANWIVFEVIAYDCVIDFDFLNLFDFSIVFDFAIVSDYEIFFDYQIVGDFAILYGFVIVTAFYCEIVYDQLIKFSDLFLRGQECKVYDPERLYDLERELYDHKLKYIIPRIVYYQYKDHND